MKYLSAFLIALIVLPFSSCKEYKNQEDLGFHKEDFRLEKISYFDRFYSSTQIVSLEDPTICDDQGIIMVLYDGIKQYNPVTLSFKGLDYLNSFKIKPDSNYLHKAELYANKLVEIGINEQGALFFPYNFKLHGGADEMKGPWFSGMAQGTVLSFFSYYYEISKDKKYLDLCEKTFRSLTITQKGHIIIPSKCVSRIDSLGYIWFEEYPFYPSTSALNGFLFTVIGIYDYFCINPSNLVAQNYLKGALTTVKDNILLFRNPGNYSYYCLKHKVLSPVYHKIHIQQLNYLFLFSNEGAFKDAATLFQIDKSN
jgi:hypothetical protein